MRETFTQLCIYFTFCMLAVTMCVNFVSASGIYGDLGNINAGPDVSNKTTYMGLINQYTTNQGEGYSYELTSLGLWSIVVTAAGAIGFVLYLFTGNTTMLAALIFSGVFWGSFVGLANTVFSIGGWMPVGLISIITALTVIPFIGAIVGIFSGSG